MLHVPVACCTCRATLQASRPTHEGRLPRLRRRCAAVRRAGRRRCRGGPAPMFHVEHGRAELTRHRSGVPCPWGLPVRADRSCWRINWKRSRATADGVVMRSCLDLAKQPRNAGSMFHVKRDTTCRSHDAATSEAELTATDACHAVAAVAGRARSVLVLLPSSRRRSDERSRSAGSGCGCPDAEGVDPPWSFRAVCQVSRPKSSDGDHPNHVDECSCEVGGSSRLWTTVDNLAGATDHSWRPARRVPRVSAESEAIQQP